MENVFSILEKLKKRICYNLFCYFKFMLLLRLFLFGQLKVKATFLVQV